jgi:type I restriction enzyme R subunit
MNYNEADTRAKLIDPAIHKRGWIEDFIRREVTAGAIEIIGGKARRRGRGRVDYTLRIQVHPETQPVAVALIEAKKSSLPPGHGLDQGKGYATCERLNIPFVFSSNGHLFWKPRRRNPCCSPTAAAKGRDGIIRTLPSGQSSKKWLGRM